MRPCASSRRHGLEDRLAEVDATEARRVADSPRFVGGLMTPDLATIQPAKLARELRRVLLERGVRIYEGTPMSASGPASRCWSRRRQGGSPPPTS